MRHSLCYLETNKWYRYQENIVIAKKINICTVKFLLKESEQSYRYNLAGCKSRSTSRLLAGLI